MRRVVGAVVVMAAIGAWNLIGDWFVRTRTVADPPVFSRSAGDSLPVKPATDAISAPVISPRSVASLPFLTHPLVFLSTAPADSLDLLPGVGPVLAGRIIATRRAHGPFRAWSQVLAIRGIGPRTVARWQALAAGQ